MRNRIGRMEGRAAAGAAIWAAAWGLLAVKPADRGDWVLENLLIWLTVAGLIFTYWRCRLSLGAYGLLGLFLLLHAVGAHYSYDVPLVTDWLKQAGFTDLSRSSYDRVVHASFGLLCVLPIREALGRWTGMKAGVQSAAACVTILALGAFYELIEMWVAFLVAPELGTTFVGAQGDAWDAQHDMELALYGALLAVVLRACFSRMTAKKRRQEAG
ncbi:DUF2238 domain-containing protein [Paenibacillus whitsoniae]|uniref:DUF2238 domain-containing protein n=1 Tax=Paenibacillus whitsoniae TaxID=2496558 RepID=A0A3S0ANA2_9BACL|nr:DUF2238 domain-containing protein [Paenibacillus whitsoniae]RTE08344.1 DUF2238 domain-containing protein [Paenibacillus whitsoniae]